LQNLDARLIFEEYRLRHWFGDRPELASYQQRFPHQFPDLKHILQLEASRNKMGRSGFEQSAPASAPEGVLPFGGGYKLIKRLGGGGFADVYYAEAPGGVHVALKQVKQTMDAAEAQNEFKALELVKNLRHPCILPTYAFFLWEGRLYIVMELADGTLRDRLKPFQKKGEGVPLAELLKYMREAAAGLDFLHDHKILHRDIKPENILLLQGFAKVGDLGLARLTQSVHLSATGGFGGTPYYMAPEAWGGEVTTFTDQYALAMTYAELRRGFHPFEGRRSLPEIMIAHAGGIPDLAPMPEAEQVVVRKALAKDAAGRFTNCKEFVRALEEATAPELRFSNPELFGSLGGSAASTRDSASSNLHSTLTALEGDALLAGVERRPLSEDKTPLWHASLPPTPPSRRPGLLVFLIAATLLLALVLWQLLFKSVPSYSLITPPPLFLLRGTSQTIPLQVQRFGFNEPIRLSFSGLPPGVEMEDATIPGSDGNVQVRVKVAPDAEGGNVRVQATAGENEQSVMLELDAGPLAYVLPSDWVRAPGARLEEIGGKFYYDKIDVVRGAISVRFLLMPPSKEPPVATFYIMQDKVWVALFRRFVKESGEPLKNQDWETKIPSNQKNEEYPVMGVVPDDAHACAVWLGGKLPLPDQWDLAAGRYDKTPREGPFQGKWDPKGSPLQIAINRKEPLERGKATDDVSPHYCHHMSGNGLEWTRRLASSVPGQDTELPRKAPDATYQVKLRGCRYTDLRPLLFRDLDADPGRGGPGSEDYTDTVVNPQIGFRVVLEP
jgi:serine/threonine protein kinase